MILPSLLTWSTIFYMIVGSLARLRLVPDAFPTNIPAEEAQTLLDLENDEEEDIFDFHPRDWESPVYPLIYDLPLPIPSVKEPLMYVQTIQSPPHLYLITPYPLGKSSTPSQARTSGTSKSKSNPSPAKSTLT